VTAERGERGEGTHIGEVDCGSSAEQGGHNLQVPILARLDQRRVASTLQVTTSASHTTLTCSRNALMTPCRGWGGSVTHTRRAHSRHTADTQGIHRGHTAAAYIGLVDSGTVVQKGLHHTQVPLFTGLH
jgi:hypothetical protein